MLPAFRYLAFAVGIVLVAILIVVVYLARGIPISVAGVIYLFGCSIIVIGLVAAPWWHQRALILSLSGVAILIITVFARILFPPSGSRMNLITLPGASDPRLLTRIFNEQDMVLFGAKIAPSIGFVSQHEYQSLIPNLAQIYREMDVAGITPLSPVLTTYLGQQHPDRFDALVTEPSSKKSDAGIIFLHGFGGNFTLQCWLIAKAANRVGAVTLCPSTDPSGQWWGEQSITILQESLDYLHQRGVKKIFLAGLSNGGIGASRLANQFKNDLAGLILISGADPNAEITGLPVLVIQGKSDERIPESIGEAYASASTPNSTIQIFDSDHFVLLKETNKVQTAIADWLHKQEER